MEAGRNFSSSGSRSSNVRPAINDGQWHSFGNAASSGRNSGALAHSSLSARNAGISDGGWHSFGPTRGAFGGAGFGFRGGAWRGGGPGFGWRGGCCWDGWGWGFGFGWPFWSAYWGPGWAFGWDPWWYSPYWYAPLAYSYYPDYSLNWEDNPPPYRPDLSSDYGSSDDDSPGYNAPASYLPTGNAGI